MKANARKNVKSAHASLKAVVKPEIVSLDSVDVRAASIYNIPPLL